MNIMYVHECGSHVLLPHFTNLCYREKVHRKGRKKLSKSHRINHETDISTQVYSNSNTCSTISLFYLNNMSGNLYGDMNENGHHRHIGRGNIRRWALVGVGVDLLDKIRQTSIPLNIYWVVTMYQICARHR